MPIVQQLFAHPQPRAARRRAIRPFRPAPGRGPYRLPHEIADRLREALAPFRNREAAFTLAVFIARFWSVPGRVAGAFPIDRRALAEHAGLALTEARVRGAIRTLEAIGFLDRALTAGSAYKPTPEGLHRKPIAFVFGSDYAPAFLAANARAAAARGRPSHERRSVPAGNTRRPSVAVSEAPALNSPKSKSEADPQVIMGELTKSGSPPPPFEPYTPLEAALERLRRAAEGQGRLKAAPRRDS